MIRALFFGLALTTPSAAQTARVLSGEHGEFTRLVIELPSPGAWSLGRTEAGYTFAVTADAQPDYDLSSVWQRIERSRLSALVRDAETGTLSLALGCDCHIFPFEYRPGIVVLDIKPGPAPAGSTFETPFIAAAPADPEAEADSATDGYSWLADRDRKPDKTTTKTPSLPFPLDTGTVSLDPLREELLEQLARGAADGVVDMELPGKPQEIAEVDHAALPWSNIRIGEAPGVFISDPDAFPEGAKPAAACADPSLLDLPGWGSAQLPYELLAGSRASLYGEFDTPEPKAIEEAVKRLLYLGFGAEARQTTDMVEDGAFIGGHLEFYRSMALLIDGESDPQTPFAAMLDCDGPAALWAALAHDRLPAGPGLRRDSILQAFAALPAHLRRHLGPALAEKFLARDDAEAARIIGDAIERAPDADKAAVALLDAMAELHRANPELAQVHAETAVALDGNKAENLVALVETHFRTLDPLAPEIAEALLALQGESEGTPDGPAVDRAVVLALALSNQTEAAFREPANSRETLNDLWRVTEERATDDNFLVQSVLPAQVSAPDISPDIQLAIAERLVSLGFPDAAQVWIGPVGSVDPPTIRLVAAEAAYQQGDARTALDLIEDLGDEALALRAKASIQLGDHGTAELAMKAAGDADAAARLSTWKGNWTELDSTLPVHWRNASELVTAAPAAGSPGLLGRSRQAIEASLASREVIEALLASVSSSPLE